MNISIEIKDKLAQRRIIPQDFELTDWESISPYLKQLAERNPLSVDDLLSYMREISEVTAVINEEIAWRYIRYTSDTRNEERLNSYQQFVKTISPKVSTILHEIHQKLVNHALFDQVDNQDYLPYVRELRNQIQLFHEENIPLIAEAKSLSQRFGAISGAMTIDHNGEKITIKQAVKWLEKDDREEREVVWKKVQQRRTQDKEELHQLFDQLIEKRNQIALNAGFSSYTAYKFQEMGRFDYKLADTQSFHHAVEKVAKPFNTQLMEERSRKLNLSPLKPWDLQIDIYGNQPLRPFEDADKLVGKTISLLSEVKPELGEMIALMNSKGYLDLENRDGKAPGGYNYPLPETGIPFIFMNATGTQDDVTTMLHESGHAVHSFLTNDIPLVGLKDTPSEVAELASMTMELLALDYYDIFYPDPQERTRAMKTQLSRTISIFPWVATVDAFQQWAYLNPKHTHSEREDKWEELYIRFQGIFVDWTDHQDILRILWQKQLHIYEVPFYYIEYALAQLGAIAIWKKYKEDPEKGLTGYLKALKLGYTRTIPEIYDEAGIQFDFSEEYMRDCLTFCMNEYQALKIN